MREKTGNNINTGRLRMLCVIFPVCILGVLARSFQFQVLEREPWVRTAEMQYTAREILSARRGVIFDRNKNILSMDVDGQSLAVDPGKVENKNQLADTLEILLNFEKSNFNSLLQSAARSRYVMLQRHIDHGIKARLENMDEPGLIFENSFARMRPGEDLALPVLGLVNENGEGVWGIEQWGNKYLSGKDGWAIGQRDALNRRYKSIDYPVEKPVNGNNIVLTLDHALQAIVESEIERALQVYSAKNGIAVLMNPMNGEIYSMVSLQNKQAYDGENDLMEKIKNRAVQWDFEPGSVFKIVTAAAALEEGGYEPNTLIYCENGSYQIGRHTINDRNKSFAWLTLSRVIEESSNIGSAKIGEKIGKNTLYKFAQNFGFGNRTGIGLPGEASGILRPVFEWTPLSVASVSFGQEVSVSALQLACMISAVANGGELLKPQLVKRIENNYGQTIKSFDRRVIRRVIKTETAASLTSILANIVETGHAEGARVKGIRTAGKTGTAQKSLPDIRGYLPGLYVSSFVGFWPVEAPMFALVVIIDEPKGQYYGSENAAYVFGRIAERVMGVPVQEETSIFHLAVYNDKQADGLKEISEKEKMNASKPALQRSKYHMPDVRGLSVREALQVLSEYKLPVEIEGNGVVSTQKPHPGERLSSEMIFELFCKGFR